LGAISAGRWTARGRTTGATAVAGATGRRSAARTTWAARTTRAWSAFGRHGGLVIDSRGGNHQQALLAVAGNNHLALVTAFEHSIEVIQLEAVFRLALPMARHARSLEERLNVFGKGQVLLIGGGG
jgi:hypothetical protein